MAAVAPAAMASRRQRQPTHLGHKGLTPEVVPRQIVILHQLALHHCLRGDTGVVGAGQPQGGLAGHAVVAGHGVLDGGGEGVAQVQGTGDVGWGDDDNETAGLAGCRGRRHIGLVEPGCGPPGVPCRLHHLRVILLVHLTLGVLLLPRRRRVDVVEPLHRLLACGGGGCGSSTGGTTCPTSGSRRPRATSGRLGRGRRTSIAAFAFLATGSGWGSRGHTGR